MDDVLDTLDEGSSPHAWGALLVRFDLFAESRFIPTRVGNTRAAPSPAFRRKVHPHTLGEHELQRY